MKIAGIIILVIGLFVSVVALSMDVSVGVPAQDFGYGLTTPSMRVANANLMAQRQNLLIFAGILSVVGAILTGFGAMAPNVPPPVPVATPAEGTTPTAPEDLSYDHEITYRDGMYIVGEYHFDTISEARLHAESIATQTPIHFDTAGDLRRMMIWLICIALAIGFMFLVRQFV